LEIGLRTGAAHTLGAAKIKGALKRERRFILLFIAFSMTYGNFFNFNLLVCRLGSNTVCCACEQSPAAGSAFL